jgi:hypothetical protein
MTGENDISVTNSDGSRDTLKFLSLKFDLSDESLANGLAEKLQALKRSSATVFATEKVVAAKADDFASIRSSVKVKALAYAGNLTPGAQSTCEVMAQTDGKTEPAMYSCELRASETMAGLKPEYERFKTELQTCDPNIQFTQESAGSEATHDESWAFTGHNAGIEVALMAQDMRYILEGLKEFADEKRKQKPALLLLDITASR